MITALQDLMRGAVRSGAARAAGVPGPQVYGQVGLVHTGSGWMSWFVGDRGNIAIAAIESGKNPAPSCAFFSPPSPSLSPSLSPPSPPPLPPRR